MNKSKYRLLLILGFTLFVGSCASNTGAQAGTTPGKAPAWVTGQTTAEPGVEYFVSSGVNPLGNIALAEESAAQKLVDQISMFLGVTVTAETEAIARASLEQYDISVINSVKTRSDGTISGLSIKDRFVQTDAKGQVSVYLLAAYDKADLLKEKSRRQALVQEREDAVTIPESKGLKAELAGDLGSALRFFLEAAGVASNAEIRNADVKFERNMNNAQRVLSRLVIEKVSAQAEIAVGKNFVQPFVFSVQSTDGKPFTGLDFEASYREAAVNGQARLKRLAVKSDDKGVASIQLPAPSLAGDETLTIALDLSGYTKALNNLTGKQKTIAAGLFDTIASRRVVFDYKVISRANTIPTALIMMDLNKNGSLIRGSELAQNAAIAELTAAGFKVPSTGLKSQFLEGKDAEGILPLLPRTVGHAAQRFIFGSVRIDSFEELAGGTMAKVSVDVKVADVATQTLIYTLSFTKSVMGSNQAEAQKNAFQGAGKELGIQLVNKLP